MGQYYGIQKKNGSDIEHWKYIKKERRPDGSFRYYYDSSDADERIISKQRATRNSDGDYVYNRKVTRIRDTNKLLSSKRYSYTDEQSFDQDYLDGKGGIRKGKVYFVEKNYSKRRGKIERALNKAYENTERLAYNTIYDEDSPVSKLKKKGKKILDKIF